MILVSLDNGTCLLFHAFTVPGKDTVVFVMQYIPELFHLCFKGFDPVCLFYFEALQPGEAERYIEQCAGHNKGLCQVGNIDKIFIQPFDTCTILLQSYTCFRIFGCHSQAGKYFCSAAVALITVAEQSGQFYICLGRQSSYLIPVRSCTPVAFDGKRKAVVRILWSDVHEAEAPKSFINCKVRLM